MENHSQTWLEVAQITYNRTIKNYSSLMAGMSWSNTEGSHVLRQDGRLVG